MGISIGRMVLTMMLWLDCDVARRQKGTVCLVHMQVHCIGIEVCRQWGAQVWALECTGTGKGAVAVAMVL